MTESSQVWQVARDHLRPYGRIQRLENRLEEGWPDCIYTFRGVTGFMELKLIPGAPFTREQCMWGEAEVAVGGRWHLLARRGKEWLLMNTIQARAWFEGAPPQGIVQQTGTFPTREILKELTR